MASRTPTIRTVASKAGVGVGTVSRVLNGGPVSRLVRENVLRAIEELGFKPHIGARSLANGRSHVIGLVVNSTRGSWFSELIAGVEEALAPSRHSVLIGSLRLTGAYDPTVIHAWLEERRVDALVFVRCSSRERPLLDAAAAAGLPVALISPDVAGAAPIEVRAENALGGELAGEHLLALGHRHVAFLGGPRASTDTKDRLKGLKKAMRGAVGASELPTFFARDYYAESGSEFARDFLAAAVRPTAVVCASDALALGFSRVLLEHRQRIPHAVSVVGFDNSPESGMFWPGLTTVAQPTRLMAGEACRALLAQLEGQTVPFCRRHAVELVVRQSTGPAPRLRR